MRKEDSLKPYDAKKSVWVPDGEGGYDEAMIDTVDGDKVTCKIGWEPKSFKSAQCMQVGSILKHSSGKHKHSFLPGQPSQDGEVRRRVQHDLSQRGISLVELEG